VDALDNACGTIAVVHSLANHLSRLSISGGPLKEFVDRTTHLDPERRGHALAADAGISDLHSRYAHQGQSRELGEGVDATYHFVCFTEIAGKVYEIDGMKSFPTCHGPVSSALPFLNAAVAVIKEKYFTDPSQLDFSVISLAPPPSE